MRLIFRPSARVSYLSVARWFRLGRREERGERLRVGFGRCSGNGRPSSAATEGFRSALAPWRGAVSFMCFPGGSAFVAAVFWAASLPIPQLFFGLLQGARRFIGGRRARVLGTAERCGGFLLHCAARMPRQLLEAVRRPFSNASRSQADRDLRAKRLNSLSRRLRPTPRAQHPVVLRDANRFQQVVVDIERLADQFGSQSLLAL